MKRIALLVSVAAVLIGADPPGTEVVVAFSQHGFEPSIVEVRLGTRVVFHNMDAESGTIVAADGSFESLPLATGGEWSHRFTARGEHAYFVREHPATKGRAVVR